MDKKQDDEEKAIYTVFQECPEMEFDSIKTELQVNGWDVQKVIQNYKDRNSYDFLLVNCNN